MTPDLEQLLRIAALCLALAGGEMLHGIARATFLVPRVGKVNAQRIGISTGTLLAFAICYVSVPSLGISGFRALLALGGLLALFMALFDISIARLVMRRAWRKVAEDFDPRSGNYLSLGLVALVFIPWAVMRLR